MSPGAPGEAGPNGPGGASEQDPNDKFGPGPREDVRPPSPNTNEVAEPAPFRVGPFGG